MRSKACGNVNDSVRRLIKEFSNNDQKRWSLACKSGGKAVQLNALRKQSVTSFLKLYCRHFLNLTK